MRGEWGPSYLQMLLMCSLSGRCPEGEVGRLQCFAVSKPKLVSGVDRPGEVVVDVHTQELCATDPLLFRDINEVK